MDKELILKYLNMFKISLAIVVIALLIGVVLLAGIIPSTLTYFANKKNLAETEQKLEQRQKDLETAKVNKAKQEKLDRDGIELKAFYKSINNSGNTTSDMIAGEIQEINDLIKFYGIKIYKVDYKYDPADDTFYKEKKNDYAVCRMDMELFASYMKFQSFMKDLYKHEHFLDIQTIEINPYKKDKSILNIKMTLSLYAEKDKNAGKSREVPPANNNNLDADLNL